jgi:hypothetical protein
MEVRGQLHAPVCLKQNTGGLYALKAEQAKLILPRNIGYTFPVHATAERLQDLLTGGILK